LVTPAPQRFDLPLPPSAVALPAVDDFVAVSAQRHEVARVQPRSALVDWDHMMNNAGQHHAALVLTMSAQWIALQVPCSEAPPLTVVPARV
jgi:hypothetical protein